jgi:hypothetical protein
MTSSPDSTRAFREYRAKSGVPINTIRMVVSFLRGMCHGALPHTLHENFFKSSHVFSKTFKWGYSDFISLFEDS